jgi:hypothetical protein
VGQRSIVLIVELQKQLLYVQTVVTGSKRCSLMMGHFHPHPLVDLLLIVDLLLADLPFLHNLRLPHIHHLLLSLLELLVL